MEKKENTAEEDEADEDILRSPTIAIGSLDGPRFYTIVLNPDLEEECPVEEEEGGEEEEETDSEEGEASSSDRVFPSVLGIPTDNMVLLSGLPQSVEYYGNNSANDSINSIAPYRSDASTSNEVFWSDGNNQYNNIYMPIYVNSSISSGNSLNTNQGNYYNENGGGPVSTMPLSPAGTTPTSLPYSLPPLPPLPSTNAMPITKAKQPGFFKSTYNRFVRRKVECIHIPGIDAFGQSFVAIHYPPYSDEALLYIQTQQQQKPSQEMQQELPWRHQQQLMQQHAYLNQYHFEQREDDLVAALSVKPASETRSELGSTLSPSRHGGGDLPQPPIQSPTPYMLNNARMVDAESARRRVQEQRAAEKAVADRLAQFMGPPLPTPSFFDI